MACSEGDKLKSEVLSKVEEYLAAENAQSTSSSFEEEFSRARTERAHALVFEARRRYFQHLKAHHCDTEVIRQAGPGRVNAIAV